MLDCIDSTKWSWDIYSFQTSTCHWHLNRVHFTHFLARGGTLGPFRDMAELTLWSENKVIKRWQAKRFLEAEPTWLWSEEAELGPTVAVKAEVSPGLLHTGTQQGTQQDHNRNTTGTQQDHNREHNRITTGTQQEHNREHVRSHEMSPRRLPMLSVKGN